jgi:RNA polymerase sigma-70 factor (ECF subfamily)
MEQATGLFAPSAAVTIGDVSAGAGHDGSQAEGTSITLLGRLRQEPADSSAWRDFVARYRPRIVAYCLAFPLQQADAEDVTQAVLVKLIAKMRDFRYDPTQSFRAWLKTVTRNALLDFLDDRRRGAGAGNSDS